jgi:hypothetical protein
MEIIHTQMRMSSIGQQTLAVLYVEFVVFDLITAYIRFKCFWVFIKFITAAKTKDSALGMKEPPFAESVLYILLHALA